jgi:hypothetical protein
MRRREFILLVGGAAACVAARGARIVRGTRFTEKPLLDQTWSLSDIYKVNRGREDYADRS